MNESVQSTDNSLEAVLPNNQNETQPSIYRPVYKGSSSTTRTDEGMLSDDEFDEELPEGFIRIRIKYLDERQKWVQANPQDTIGDFKRYIWKYVFIVFVY